MRFYGWDVVCGICIDEEVTGIVCVVLTRYTPPLEWLSGHSQLGKRTHHSGPLVGARGEVLLL